ncbi:hypothetical protein DV736_g690, partial [Chaetothyriales sp. CBS 134916]
MGVVPSGLAVPGPSHGVLRTADTTPVLNVGPEAPHPKAIIRGFDEQPEKMVYFLSPGGKCRYKPGHEACKVHGMRAADGADVDNMAVARDMTVNWSGMHMQGNAQIPKVEGTAANSKSGRGAPSQQASASSALLSKGSEKATGIMIDDKIEQSIMGASDQELAELAKSFDDSKGFPEWYKKLPEAQRDMFDKKAGDNGDKGNEKKQNEKDDKGAKNSSSTLTVNTMLKMGALAMFCMVVL